MLFLFMVSYYIREHEMVQHDTGTSCKHCNSFTTLGDYFFMRCSLRFNEKGFSNFLEFRNISPTGIKRFSNIQYKLKDLKKDFRKLTINNELTKSIINTKEYFSGPKM